ncbi:MAG: virulence RhuM family protein [Bacilli bacterium]|nr:virulence RhuM family protein [Bacilli bacterium]
MVHRGAGKHPCFYNTDSNGTKVEVKLIDGNLWLTQEQIVALYNSSKPNISEHIKHILEEGELDEKPVVRKFRTTANDGKQYNVIHYNLDMVLAIGYRVIKTEDGFIFYQK